MKKIIANKVYDTATAQCVGGWSNMDDAGNLSYVWEGLYRKRTGELFLHGEGGPATKYAQTLGQNSWGSGEKIIPLTYDAAREWAEEKLTGDEYEAIFGLPADDDGATALYVNIDSATLAAARQAAAQAGSTLSAWVEDALRGALV